MNEDNKEILNDTGSIYDLCRKFLVAYLFKNDQGGGDAASVTQSEKMLGYFSACEDMKSESVMLHFQILLAGLELKDYEKLKGIDDPKILADLLFDVYANHSELISEKRKELSDVEAIVEKIMRKKEQVAQLKAQVENEMKEATGHNPVIPEKEAAKYEARIEELKKEKNDLVKAFSEKEFKMKTVFNQKLKEIDSLKSALSEAGIPIPERNEEEEKISAREKFSKEIVTFRKEYGENEAYSIEQRSFLTALFAEPKGLSLEEIKLIASPAMEPVMMKALADKLRLGRKEWYE